MRYLMRDGAPLTDSQWERLDKAVIGEASKILVGRRFLDVKVVGVQTQTVHLDKTENVTAASLDFWGRKDSSAIDIGSREFIELMMIYSDFLISWRDVESEQGAGVQAARDAAVLAAQKEDSLIFHGDEQYGIEGIFTAKGVNELPISDWNEGENAVRDVAKAIEILVDKGNSGDRALIVANDLYTKLHRIQPGTGLMEIDRVRSLAGKLLKSSRLKPGTACLVYCEPQNMDLVVGQDMITAYMGNEKLDHLFRVMETAVPRIKRPQAIAVFK